VLSVRFTCQVGGHNVSGHVHTTATISHIDHLPNNRRITMTLTDPARWLKYILPKVHSPLQTAAASMGVNMCFEPEDDLACIVQHSVAGGVRVQGRQ
jgi:riboflavin synthase alpha subunit